MRRFIWSDSLSHLKKKPFLRNGEFWLYIIHLSFLSLKGFFENVVLDKSDRWIINFIFRKLPLVILKRFSLKMSHRKRHLAPRTTEEEAVFVAEQYRDNMMLLEAKTANSINGGRGKGSILLYEINSFNFHFQPFDKTCWREWRPTCRPNSTSRSAPANTWSKSWGIWKRRLENICTPIQWYCAKMFLCYFLENLYIKFVCFWAFFRINVCRRVQFK